MYKMLIRTLHIIVLTTINYKKTCMGFILPYGETLILVKCLVRIYTLQA
jgi:hypothetical protein